MTELRELTLPNGDIAPLTLRHSKRAKRVALRLVPGSSSFELVIPDGFPAEKALTFARDQESWLAARTARLSLCQPFVAGMEIPYRGQTLRIETTARGLRRVELVQDRLIVWPLSRDIDSLVTAWLKDRARERLTELARAKASAIGRPFKRLSLRDGRTRWGSCSASGNLNFSWRVIMAPDFVADYLAAHEVAHLVHMNHSPDFWSVAATLADDMARGRGWLRENGASLHVIGGR